MFESFEKRAHRKSVVQPVLALAVHAGLISLALRAAPEPDRGETTRPIPARTVFVLSTQKTDGSPLPGGTRGEPPLPVPIDVPTGLPPIGPLKPGPITGPTFDPGRYLPGGTSDTMGVLAAEVLTESDLTDPPQALHLAEPRYPEALRRAGIDGAVIVTYIVDAAGLVEPTSIRIVSSDHPAFAEAVLASVGTARFTPGRVHGRAVRVLVRQVIRFATRS
ncbi:MAG TPA: energy transducer TonB [Gemmatimonadales bacterium]|nr:energy transducer TonB [Gemmatimonadales bacterium]